jgi:hypothetical protein
MLIPMALALSLRAGAQTILFDFENAPGHTSLPINLTVSGLTAHFSATGQGFSIQPADSMGFTPAGFSGLCIYPNSIYAADLLVSFSAPLADFTILYAPQELACDSSATMRVSAYLNGALVGTATTNAQPGTWPTETLQVSSTRTFNSVVVHYDKAPVTGGDYGVIFMADNMQVTLAPPRPAICQVARWPGGAFQFAFTNNPGLTFTVLAATNLMQASWDALGAAAEISPGQYQFTDLQATNSRTRFYRVSWP